MYILSAMFIASCAGSLIIVERKRKWLEKLYLREFKANKKN